MSDNENIGYESPIENDAENGGGDDMWQIPQEENVLDSYQSNLRAAGYVDEGWEQYSSAIEGQEQFLTLSPEERFRYDTEVILTTFRQSNELGLDQEDRRRIMGEIEDLHWTRFQSPINYVLGYYVAIHEFHPDFIDYAVSILRTRRRATRAIDGLMRFSIIRSARHWKYTLAL